MKFTDEDVGKYYVKGLGANAPIYKLVKIWTSPTVIFENVKTGEREQLEKNGTEVTAFIKVEPAT